MLVCPSSLQPRAHHHTRAILGWPNALPQSHPRGCQGSVPAATARAPGSAARRAGGLTHGAVPEDDHLPVAEQRHGRRPPQARKAGDGGVRPQVLQALAAKCLTSRRPGQAARNQNKRRSRSRPRDHNTARLGRASPAPGAGRAAPAPGSAPMAARHWPVGTSEGGVSGGKEWWASRGPGERRGAHARARAGSFIKKQKGNPGS